MKLKDYKIRKIDWDNVEMSISIDSKENVITFLYYDGSDDMSNDNRPIEARPFIYYDYIRLPVYY